MRFAQDTSRAAKVFQRSPAVYRMLLTFLLTASMVTPASAAVRRRLNIRTNPPGALVYVDNQQIGTTPCGVDFTYYGTREIRLVKPGYETLTVNQPIPTPWYQVPPLDFVSENLWPTKIRDNRTVTFNLAPQLVVPTQQLLDRANELRVQTLQQPVIPAAAMGPVVAPAPPPTVVAPPTMITPTAPGLSGPPPAGTPIIPLPPTTGTPGLVPPP